MARCYPVALNIEGRLCLVVGGGAVAERKTAGLLHAGARVRIVAPSITSGLMSLEAAGRIDVRIAPYDSSDLEGVALAFAATDVREVNSRVAQDAAAAGVWANVADSPEEGAFLTPSILRRGDLVISVSTGGANPMLAARLVEELGERFGQEFGRYVELLGEMRSYMKESTQDPAVRKAALSALLDAERDLRARIRDEGLESAKSLALSLVQDTLGTLPTRSPKG